MIDEAANNVIQFPKFKTGQPQNEEELETYFNENKKQYIDYLCDRYCSNLFNKFAGHGFDVMNEEFTVNFSYSVEVIRYTLYQSLQIDHPLKEHIQDMLELEHDPDIPPSAG